ncbi:hypothetical protein B9Z65_4205 [Elsinoe australis]|uniref:Uncharacterized protein n=1 Tax=Elsinoe australis TaxID=40998 RepID=A0A2P7Z271_9PEZI|nr:hypothetical protein B9Z65_4205 [Elsinoe australis]
MAISTMPVSSQEGIPSQQMIKAEQEIFYIVKDLPFELREHVSSYLQEELYAPAFSLLQNLLISGADQVSGNQQRIFLPSPQIIALASTLIVYPPLTTRLPSTDKPYAADLALRYIRHLKIIPSLNSGLADIFTFASSDPNRSGRRRRRASLDNGESRLEEVDGRLTTKIATEDSIFERADDFWSVVGWAFNCSVRHQQRWVRWHVWLEAMLDLVDKDLSDRCAETSRQDVDDNSEYDDTLVKEALISKYLTLRTSGRGEKKRIIRAILADGSKHSLNEFGEVWKFETKPPKERSQETAQEKQLDFDNDQYGDYMDIDGDDLEADLNGNLAPRKSGRRTKASYTNEDEDDIEEVLDENLTYTIADYGGISSILLRQRLFGLLIRYTEHYPAGFMNTSELFDLIAEQIRPIALHTFSHFVTPSKSWISNPHAQCALLLDLLCTITGQKPPAFKKGIIEQDDLEKYYLPATASSSTAVDNAKVSIMVEALMRLLWKYRGLESRSSLSNAVQDGRKARFKKIEFERKKTTQQGIELTEQARETISHSAMRMAALLDVL